MRNDETPTCVSPEVPTDPQRRGVPERAEPWRETASEPALPAVGTSFLGFRLRAVLGCGAFGQVYLAEQEDLAHRYVALKVAPDIFGESQTLAQLQHTHIVPIYSLHRVEPYQAVCMPYLGATTLADVLGQTQEQPSRPISGKVLVDTVKDRRRTVVLTGSASQLPPAQEAMPAKPPSALQQLERMSYVEAVVWLGERLADGLAHAHEHGILHHDLKPANILLTEDGQPMLLDFSISEDTKNRGRATILGGTLPYMSPEQLAALGDGTRRLDGRSDVYALGVIFHELLAGRLPYRTGTRFAPDAVATMLKERQHAPPALDAANPAVTPAVASIVAHCLEPNPARRYQSARELQEDLRRQRLHLPLRYARERSIRERTKKWVRRHPRLTSMTSVALLLGAFLAALGTVLVWRHEQAARLEAKETLEQFRADAATVQFLLYSRRADPAQLGEGLQHGHAALDRFAILDDANWLLAPQVRRLLATDQAALREEAGEVLFLLARATARLAPPGRAEMLRDAHRLNRQAEAAFGEDHVPRALWEQRADLAHLLGDATQAAKAAQRARQVPVRTPRDRYLIAHQHALHGQLRDAVTLLRTVTQDDPRNFAAWFVRGNCHYDLLQDGQAVTCYSACVALRPDFPWTWFNRGLAHLRTRQYRDALADFEQALRLRPDLAEGDVCRGLALEGIHAYAEAVTAYTQALAAPAASTRIYFLRAAARSKTGDAAGARRDYAQGLKVVPADELGWLARATARRDRDPKGAFADYEEALKLNPRSFDGLQNKAALLSDKFHKDAEALAVLELAVKLYPESVLARGGRGVLLARAGKRTAALAEARACLLLDASPATQYQAACIYALTARQNAEDRRQALPLLSAALRAGFGLDFVDHDADLDALRALPEYQRLLAGARALRAPAPRRQSVK